MTLTDRKADSDEEVTEQDKVDAQLDLIRFQRIFGGVPNAKALSEIIVSKENKDIR